MAGINSLHIIGIVVTLSIIVLMGINSGKKVKTASDFSTGGSAAGTMIVTGALISTLIGGASTIGTAELAYSYGLTAWWFTLGTGIGCLFFGTIFVKPIRESSSTTIQQIISEEYGTVSGIVTSVFNSFGFILNIVAQNLAANALLTSVFNINSTLSSILTVIIMICYVVFGGVLGTGLLGIIKLVLIYIAVIFGSIFIISHDGGLYNVYNSLPYEQYFNMFSRGFGIDLGSAVAVIIGVICGQSYVNIILSGKSTHISKKATIISAAMLPPVGLGGVLIGMYMKINYPYLNPGHAFPVFIIEKMPPLLGGAILAILLIALVGTGSGLALGLGTILTNDIYKKFINKNSDSKNELFVNRLIIVITFIVSAVIANINMNSSILSWSFLATGLRGTVLLVPMCCALFYKDKIDSRFAVLSSLFGIGLHALGEIFLDLSYDPIFLGIGASIICVMVGYIVHKIKYSV